MLSQIISTLIKLYLACRQPIFFFLQGLLLHVLNYDYNVYIITCFIYYIYITTAIVVVCCCLFGFSGEYLIVPSSEISTT